MPYYPLNTWIYPIAVLLRFMLIRYVLLSLVGLNMGTLINLDMGDILYILSIILSVAY